MKFAYFAFINLLFIATCTMGGAAHAYDSEDDPGHLYNSKTRELLQRANENELRRQAYLKSVIEQAYGGEARWNDWYLTYDVCQGGQLNSCAGGSPISDCPKSCSNGTLRVCSTSTKFTKTATIDTIKCSGAKPIRLVEPDDIVQ